MKIEKLGMALGALVGSIVFVLAMLGFMTIFGYLAWVVAIVAVAGLLVALGVRFLQLQVRLLMFYGLVGLVAALLAISLIPRTDRPVIVAMALLTGVLIGVLLQFKNLALYRKITQPEVPRQEYTDDVGDRHLYTVYGYHQLPGAIKDRPLNLVFMFLGLWVILIVVAFLLTWNRVIDGATVWASVWAFVSALGLIEGYSSWKVERETGVQIFSQFLPGDVNAQSGSRLTAALAKPVAWAFELLRDIWDSLRELYSVSIRA